MALMSLRSRSHVKASMVLTRADQMKFSRITIYAIMSLRSRSHVKESMVLKRADHLFINNYIRSLLNNILRPIVYN